MALVTVTGNLKSIIGGNPKSGTISFILTNFGNVPPIVSGTGIVVDTQTVVAAAGDGSFTASIQGNDTISPANTYYAIRFDDPSGGMGAFLYSITGSSVDLNTLPPVTTPSNPILTGVILTNPAADQTIASHILTVPTLDVTTINVTTANATTVVSGSSLNSASQGTLRVIDSEPSLSFSGSTTITGSVAAVRGNITQAVGNTLANGFEYGIQGKLTLKGTLANGSGFNAGVFGQIDTSNAAFVHTSGYLAPITGDFGATSIMANDVNANMITVLNTTNCIINSALQFIGNASYAFDLTDLNFGGVHFANTSAANPTTAGGQLKVLVNGHIRYIQLYSTSI